ARHAAEAGTCAHLQGAALPEVGKPEESGGAAGRAGPCPGSARTAGPAIGIQPVGEHGHVAEDDAAPAGRDIGGAAIGEQVVAAVAALPALAVDEDLGGDRGAAADGPAVRGEQAGRAAVGHAAIAAVTAVAA